MTTRHPPAYNHEVLGRAVIRYDDQLNAVLKSHGISNEDVRAVFSREAAGALTNLVSSDLDCDRLDYLMRTAHCAGLPYGKVDIEYITSKMSVDSEGNLCLTKKALRAVDHLLVSRYFDYTQVAFHKTVVALEIVLRDIIGELLKRGLFDASGTAIKKRIQTGSFAELDDQFMISKIRDALANLPTSDSLHKKIKSVLNREPPKMVASHEAIGSGANTQKQAHKNITGQLKKTIDGAANRFGIPRDLWHLWQASLSLSKIGSKIPLSDMDSFEEESAQAVRILSTEPNATQSASKLLVDHDFALMKHLSEYRYYAIRLFVHIPKNDNLLRAKIQEYFRAELPDFPFSP